MTDGALSILRRIRDHVGEISTHGLHDAEINGFLSSDPTLGEAIGEAEQRFEALCEEVGFESVDLDGKKYAVLAYLITKSERLNFGGLEVKGLCEGSLDVSKLMSILESEMYARAQAHYERNFKIKV